MEKEEKEKVIIDYDKYQELLAKANLNEKAIKEIKDAAYKEGLDFGNKEISRLDARYKNLCTKYSNLNSEIDRLTKETYNEGHAAGLYIRKNLVGIVCRDTIEKLNICFGNCPASNLWLWDIYADETLRHEIISCVEKAFVRLLDLKDNED